MKNFKLLKLLTAIYLSIIAGSHGLEVIIIAGQSNADGLASSELPSIPSVPYYYGQDPQAVIDSSIWDPWGGAVATHTSPTPSLYDHVATGILSGTAEEGGTGPELALAHALVDGNAKPFAIIKYANGATAMDRWVGETDYEYQRLQTTVTNGLAALAAEFPGEQLNIAGFLWTQGESDANVSRSTAEYETDLNTFISKVRSDYGAALPFIYSRISDSQTTNWLVTEAEIIAAQNNVADPSASQYLIDTDGFGIKNDKLHFDTAGTRSLANAFSDVLFSSGAIDRLTLVDRLEAGDNQTIVAYGTSLTKNGAWVDQLKTVLEQSYPGQTTVINSGGSGKHSGWGVSNLDGYVINQNPDTVFIEFAMNDSKRDFDEAQANLENMIDRILVANADCEIILMTMNPVFGDGYWDRESQTDRETLVDYYQMYRDVAQEHGLQLIDHYSVWKDLLDQDPGLFIQYIPDSIHPIRQGALQVIMPTMMTELGIPQGNPELSTHAPSWIGIFNNYAKVDGGVTIDGHRAFWLANFNHNDSRRGNGDDVLTPNEYKPDSLFEHVDADSNGEITAEEYQAVFLPLFTNHDVDSDGKMFTSELWTNPISYTVSFKSGEGAGAVSVAVRVEKDGAASAPTPAVVAGKTFSDWDQSFDQVTGYMIVNAVYSTGSSLETKVSAGDDWKYIVDSVASDTSWYNLGYDDSTWLIGPTGMGFRDGDDATELARGTGRVFMRKTFDLTDASSVTLVEFTVDYDDGYAAYLNGTLIASGTAPDPVTNTSFATGSHEAGVPVTIDVSTLGQPVLVDGTNVLAVVGLNIGVESSDMSIIPELRIVSNSGEPELTHTVTFISGEGTQTDPVTVVDGQAAEAPTPAAVAGKTFTAWDQSFGNVTGPMTINALYSTSSGRAKVFLLAGSSNMAGQGVSNGLNYAPYNDFPYNAAQTDVSCWVTVVNNGAERIGNSWVDLAPGLGRRTHNFGPEVTFGHAIRQALPEDEDIYLIKYTSGGSTLHNSLGVGNSWNVGPSNVGTQYTGFMDTVAAALANLDASGVDYEIAGMLWLQGEIDADDGQAAAYEENLRDFIADMRSQFESPYLPFIISRKNNYHGTSDQNALVRSAQEVVADETANVEWFAADDEAVFGELINAGHYGTVGTVEIGKAFATAFLGMVSEPEPIAENDSYQTPFDTVLTITAPGVLSNDSDLQSDPITAVLDTDVTIGSLVLNSNGSFDYTPAAGFAGVDTFTYHANDGVANSNIVTVAITVNPEIVTPQGVVYHDTFDNDGLATNSGTGGGLEALSYFNGGVAGTGDNWDDNGDLSCSNSGGDGDRAVVSSLNSFDLSDGFKLTVKWTGTDSQFGDSFGLSHKQWTAETASLPWTAQDPLGWGGGSGPGGGSYDFYGIGLAFADTSDIANPYDKGLIFNDASGANGYDGTGQRIQLSNAQTIPTSGDNTFVLTVAGNNYSYSINGAAATTGTIEANASFDLSNPFYFNAYSQAGATTITEVMLESLSVSGPTDPIEVWRANNGFTSSDGSASGEGDLDNIDGDQLGNLLEFAFGTDPMASESSGLSVDGSVNGAPILNQLGGGEMEIIFVRRDDHGQSGSLVYKPQFSSDLSNFFDSDAEVIVLTDSSDDPNYEVVKVGFPANLPNGEQAQFFRMEVEIAP